MFKEKVVSRTWGTVSKVTAYLGNREAKLSALLDLGQRKMRERKLNKRKREKEISLY